jgi:hypothetical protein
VPDEGLHAFMQHCSQRIGDAYFRTPRTTIKEFLNLLSILEHNPGQDWRPLVGAVRLDAELNPDLEPLEPSAGPLPGSPPAAADDDLATFRL